MNAYLKFLEQVVPATVCIKTEIPETHPTSSILGTERMGSGTLIDPRGFILTVGYVVLGASSIIITLQDRREFPGRVVYHDFESGISILKIRATNLPNAFIGNTQELSTGQSVLIVAATNPQERRASDGVITSISPFDAYWEYMLDKAIFTMAINPGFGGGALLNYRGEIIGIVSLNLGFIKDCSMVIPIDYFLRHKEELFKEGTVTRTSRRAWLGFYIMPSYQGVLIYGLVAGGPAEKAGLKTGDIIIYLDGYEVGGSRTNLYKELWKRQAGQEISITIVRQGKLITLSLLSADRAEFYA